MFCPKGEVGPPIVGIVPPGICVPTEGCVVTVLCLGKGKGKGTVPPCPPTGICKLGATVGIVPLGLGLPGGNGGSVGIKVGIPGEPAGVCGGVGLEAFNKAFNAW
jgi:hypothetical protein